MRSPHRLSPATLLLVLAAAAPAGHGSETAPADPKAVEVADQMMAALASLGDAAVLGPAAAVALLWLLWRRRWIAAAPL